MFPDPEKGWDFSFLAVFSSNYNGSSQKGSSKKVLEFLGYAKILSSSFSKD